MLLCGKFIEDNTQQILSESAKFNRRYDKSILGYFSFGDGSGILNMAFKWI